VQQILFAKSKADVERESVRKCKIGRVFVRQGGRESEEVETLSGSRRRGGNNVRKSAERRRQGEQLEGKAEKGDQVSGKVKPA